MERVERIAMDHPYKTSRTCESSTNEPYKPSTTKTNNWKRSVKDFMKKTNTSDINSLKWAKCSPNTNTCPKPSRKKIPWLLPWMENWISWESSARNWKSNSARKNSATDKLEARSESWKFNLQNRKKKEELRSRKFN